MIESSIRTRSTLAFLGIAIAELGALYYLSYQHPELYAYVVLEDHVLENTQFVMWLLVAVLMSRRILSNRQYRKPLYVLIAAGSFLVAMDEISWGQRLFDIVPPTLFQNQNLQAELTLHNFVMLPRYYPIIGLGILGWALTSIYVMQKPALVERWGQYGIVIMPPFLLPMFLTAAWLSLPHDWIALPERDEVFEFALALSVLILVITSNRLRVGWKAIASIAAVLVVLVTGLTHIRPASTSLQAHMNFLASHHYPSVDMFKQSVSLYEHIMQHPDLVSADTRTNHGKVLIHVGETRRGIETLSLALQEEYARPLRIRSTATALRRRGTILSELGHMSDAASTFRRALARDYHQLANADTATERFTVQLSIARTLIEMDDIVAAESWFTRAFESAPTRRQRWRADVMHEFELERARTFRR